MNRRGFCSLVVGLCLFAFRVAGQAPIIDSFTPTSGPIGTPVTINGANFSATASSNIVYFGAVRALVTSAATNSLEVLAPAGANYRPMTVTTAGLTAASKTPFFVTFGGTQALQFDGRSDYSTDQAAALAVGDLDADVRPDLATLAAFDQTGGSVGGFLLVRNTSTPGILDSSSFAPPEPLIPNYPAISGSRARAAVIADLDGDGKLDLVETVWFGDFLVIFRNNGTPGPLTSGSFATPVLISVPDLSPGSQGLAVADLDGDGRPDIVFAGYSSSVLVLKNLSSPGNIDSNSFALPVAFLTNQSVYAISIADLDCDGRPDILALTYPGGPALLRNVATGSGIDNDTFAEPVMLSISPQPEYVEVADVDGDGRPDIVTMGVLFPQSTVVTILRNLTSGPGLDQSSFGQQAEITMPFNNGSASSSMALGDLDGDGKVDLAVVTPLFENNSSLSVFLNQGSPGTISSNSFAQSNFDVPPFGYSPVSLALVDLDGDGKTDVVLSRSADNGSYRPRALLSVFHNTTPLSSNSPPSVRIVSPTNGATFRAPAEIPITAEASDSDGSVLQVSFFSGTDLLKVAMNPPYVFAWTNVPVGNYTLTAKALDNLGRSTTSAPVTIAVAAAPVITAQPQSRSVGVDSNATFTVTATGTPALSFQWLFNGTTTVAGATSTLTLTNVQFASAGQYSVIVSNAAGSALSDSADLTIIPTDGRLLRVANTSGSPGGLLAVPVYLVGQGNENAVEFSITFPTSVLAYASIQLGSGAADAVFNANQDQIPSGRLGVSLALTAGSAFAAGTQELVVVTFAVADNIGTTAASISFGDQPLGREISDPLANSLRASYLGGTVMIVGAGFEGDVTPVPDGNGNVTVTDWIKIGRYAAKLDTVPSPSQFQRADCAPRSSLGNGTITLTDWVQAGRYAAGLDPLTPAGGPTGPTGALAAKSMSALSPLAPAAAREVRIPGVGLRAGQTNRIPVLLVAQGNESGIGFSVNFDATMLSFVSAAAGSNATGAVLNVNTSQAATGQIGLVLSLPIGTNTFAMGTQEVAALRFFVSSNAMGAASAVFGDQPVIREVSDPFANTLAAVYVNGVLPVTPSLKISRGGMANVLAWPTWGSNLVLEATDNLRPMSLWNSPLATATNIAGGEIRLTIPDTLSQRFFRLRSP